MSFRAWLYIFTLGITLATSGQAQEQTERPQGQAVQQKQDAPKPSFSLPVEIVEDQSAAEARKAREEETRQREIADLAAQEGMNAATQSIKTATNDMRDYALYSAIVVGVGTVLLIWTLVLTGRANRSAHTAVGGTCDIGQKQTRAYLTRACGGVWSGTGLEFALDLKNTGNSPAFEVYLIF